MIKQSVPLCSLTEPSEPAIAVCDCMTWTMSVMFPLIDHFSIAHFREGGSIFVCSKKDREGEEDSSGKVVVDRMLLNLR